MIKAFDGLLCSNDHEHQAIEGGKAASDSAFYPKEMTDIVHTVIARSCGKKDVTPVDAAAPGADETDLVRVFDVDELWIVDSGCGRNLLTQVYADEFPDYIRAALRVALNTGGGKRCTSEALATIMSIGSCDVQIDAYFMDDACPSVISMGYGVHRYGFAFVWLPEHKPACIAPNGIIIPLIVQRWEPYISLRAIQDALRDQARAAQEIGVCVAESGS